MAYPISTEQVQQTPRWRRENCVFIHQQTMKVQYTKKQLKSCIRGADKTPDMWEELAGMQSLTRHATGQDIF